MKKYSNALSYMAAVAQVTAVFVISAIAFAVLAYLVIY